jgi:hypothetical protein
MTPTPTLILFVALFWTLPATSAVLFYRKHGSSMENVKDVLRYRLNRVVESTQQTQLDA